MEKFLSVSERESLRIMHRKEPTRRTADRIKAVLLKDQGWTYRKISEALLLDEETISKHVDEYIYETKLKIETGGKESNLNQSQTEELVAHLEETTYLRVNAICAHVVAQYGIEYTVAGMRSWLKRNNFSHKKPKGTPAKADPEKQEVFKKWYADFMKQTPADEPVLFADGVHPTMATKISYGWIRRGQEKSIKTTGARTRVNVMGALHLTTMNLLFGVYETLNSEAMNAFFEVVRKAYPHARKIHIILDNGPYNKSAETREAARKWGIILHFLPPYSPNLNPSERVWKVMNELVRDNRFFEHTWGKIAMTLVDRINDNFQTLSKSSV